MCLAASLHVFENAHTPHTHIIRDAIDLPLCVLFVPALSIHSRLTVYICGGWWGSVVFGMMNHKGNARTACRVYATHIMWVFMKSTVCVGSCTYIRTYTDCVQCGATAFTRVFAVCCTSIRTLHIYTSIKFREKSASKPIGYIIG